MMLSKDPTSRRVVVSLLVAIVVLVPLSLVLNRVSLGSSEGFHLAEIFAYSRELQAQDSAAAVPSHGNKTGTPAPKPAPFTSEAEAVSESSAGLTEENFGAKNSNTSGNLPLAGEKNGDKSLEVTDSELDQETKSVVVDADDGSNVGLMAEDVATNDSSATPSGTLSGNLTLALEENDETDESVELEDATPATSVSSTSATPNRKPFKRGEAKLQRVFQPASLPHYSFVKFSAYRQSLHTFFVTGISSYVARTFDKDRIAHTCEWHPAGGDALPLAGRKGKQQRFVETEARALYVKSDDHHGTYGPTFINCTFASQVGADRKGGLLIIRTSCGYTRKESNRPVVAMEELPGEVDIVMTPPEKLPYKYAFCGAPMHGKVRPDWILQWMTYHHYLAEGKGHFFFYNMGGLAEKDKPLFKRFSDAGLLSITDILDPDLASDYPTFYYHQVLLINDCLHRSRFMAERVFFFDYDEFLQIPATDTLTEFVARHEDEPWISFGSIYANMRDCRGSEKGKSEAPLERMLWRGSKPECREKSKSSNPWLCIGGLGRRKYVVNPRKTFLAGVHDVLIPENGLKLLAQEAHMLHYRGAPLPYSALCDRTVAVDGRNGMKTEKEILAAGWIRDDSVSKIYSAAKTFPV